MIRPRTSVSTATGRKESTGASIQSPRPTIDTQNLEGTESNGIVHGVEPSANTAMIPPVMVGLSSFHVSQEQSQLTFGTVEAGR